MGRIKVDLAKNPIFQTEIPVRITDLNYGNHLANDRLLGILHEARIQFLESLGYSEMDLAGVGVIMADVAIEYKAQAFYGDQLCIKIGVMDVSRVSFDLTYEVSKSQETVLVAKAKSGIVTFDYHNNKVVEVPTAFLERLSEIS
ncbi:acyl-CoA thioesterase [Vaginella massiliensis]|uniref:acyl-CoA thioesterase n=1 Tax=Vaginella massiliensis TaxID=1816680 RepID=UPI00083896AB|nr:thioesterase family protein [Vaginella massiliensis]